MTLLSPDVLGPHPSRSSGQESWGRAYPYRPQGGLDCSRKEEGWQRVFTAGHERTQTHYPGFHPGDDGRWRRCAASRDCYIKAVALYFPRVPKYQPSRSQHRYLPAFLQLSSSCG